MFFLAKGQEGKGEGLLGAMGMGGLGKIAWLCLLAEAKADFSQDLPYQWPPAVSSPSLA